MKILFVAPYVPSRIRVRTFQMIRELSKRHVVHVIALRDADESRMPGVDEIRDSVEQMDIIPHSDLRGMVQSLAALPTRSPMCAAFCWSGQMRRAIDESTARHKFDVVHVEHLRAAHFAPRIRTVPVVLDSVDCLTRLFSQLAHSTKSPAGRMIAAEEAWKLRSYEPLTLQKFDRVVVTSDLDRDALLGLNGNLMVSVAPNGVDPEYFCPQGAERKPARLVFSGKMSYAPNVEAVLWFAQSMLPALRQRFSDLEFVVVGSEPPADIQRLSAIPGVSVTGYVDDIRASLDSCAISVVPMRTGVGIQNKVLEAMAMAIPVVATPLAAGTFGVGCPGIVEADSADSFVGQISHLIENPAEATEMGKHGQQEVMSRFSWQTSVNALETVYEDAVRAFRSGNQIVEEYTGQK